MQNALQSLIATSGKTELTLAASVIVFAYGVLWYIFRKDPVEVRERVFKIATAVSALVLVFILLHSSGKRIEIQGNCNSVADGTATSSKSDCSKKE
jgi:hypothetical protein